MVKLPTIDQIAGRKRSRRRQKMKGGSFYTNMKEGYNRVFDIANPISGILASLSPVGALVRGVRGLVGHGGRRRRSTRKKGGSAWDNFKHVFNEGVDWVAPPAQFAGNLASMMLGLGKKKKGGHLIVKGPGALGRFVNAVKMHRNPLARAAYSMIPRIARGYIKGLAQRGHGRRRGGSILFKPPQYYDGLRPLTPADWRRSNELAIIARANKKYDLTKPLPIDGSGRRRRRRRRGGAPSHSILNTRHPEYNTIMPHVTGSSPRLLHMLRPVISGKTGIIGRLLNAHKSKHFSRNRSIPKFLYNFAKRLAKKGYGGSFGGSYGARRGKKGGSYGGVSFSKLLKPAVPNARGHLGNFLNHAKRNHHTLYRAVPSIIRKAAKALGRRGFGGSYGAGSRRRRGGSFSSVGSKIDGFFDKVGSVFRPKPKIITNTVYIKPSEDEIQKAIIRNHLADFRKRMIGSGRRRRRPHRRIRSRGGSYGAAKLPYRIRRRRAPKKKSLTLS
jgi:hypothetical protein